MIFLDFSGQRNLFINSNNKYFVYVKETVYFNRLDHQII